MKDITAMVLNTAFLVSERAKFPVCFLFFFIRPCRKSESIFVKDQVDDLTIILLSELPCGIFKYFLAKLFVTLCRNMKILKTFFFLSPSRFGNICCLNAYYVLWLFRKCNLCLQLLLTFSLKNCPVHYNLTILGNKIYLLLRKTQEHAF